jgi:hypothetical protein
MSKHLTDHGAPGVARPARAFALNIGLQPLMTLLAAEKRMAESLVQTMKRNCIAFMPKPKPERARPL